MSLKIGIVKFYSQDKGFGFIYSEDQKDIWFHITHVVGPTPPKPGDKVNYSIARGKKGLEATSVNITQSFSDTQYQAPKFQKKVRELNGFPCVRSGSLGGFSIEKHCGGFFAKNVRTDEHTTANAAKDALVAKAQSRGANAILNYHTHRRNFSYKGFFGGKYQATRFWAEGEPVLLKADQ